MSTGLTIAKRVKRAFQHVWNPVPRIKRIEDISATGEAEFLAGRHSRLKEAGMLFRIAIEFIRAFRTFHFLPPAVTIFGSARFKEGSTYYLQAREMGAKLGREGFAVITGAGPGIMEAANRGCKEVGGCSVGANIILPFEQKHNPYVDKVVTFFYFFVRKVILVKYSFAYVIFPGGFGTLDEMSEALTLIQTGKLYDFPVVLVGKSYWKGLVDWMENTLLTTGAIHAKDLKYFYLTDDLDEALSIIQRQVKRLNIPLQRIESH